MKQQKTFKPYLLNKNYYDYLFNQNNLSQMMQKESRPYIGFVGIEINGMDYAIPLWSDNDNKYKPSHKYSLFIPDANGNKLGILLINKMVPIIVNNCNLFIEEIDFYKSSKDFMIKTLDELSFLNQPHIYDKVQELANEIYSIRYNMSDTEINNCNDTNIKYAVDFKKAEQLMYEYASELYRQGLLIEPPLLHPNHVNFRGDFSELNQYCNENNITPDDRYCIHESEATNIELLKHNDGSLEIVEEIWDSSEDEGELELFYTPWINHENDIYGKWDVNDIAKISKKDLMENILNRLSWFKDLLMADEYELDEFYEYLSDQLDEWEIKTNNHQQSKQSNSQSQKR